jgi:hypothetical protein
MMQMYLVLGLVVSVLSWTLGSSYAEAPTAPALVGSSTCALQTINGHFLTAVGGGGRTTDVLHTDATRIAAWEKFTLVDAGNGAFGLRTVSGRYLTAVGGGGRITDVLHSDAVHLQAWEKFTPHALGNGYFAIATVHGHYLTATGGGGKRTDAMHSDATRIDAWEKFKFVCEGKSSGGC